MLHVIIKPMVKHVLDLHKSNLSPQDTGKEYSDRIIHKETQFAEKASESRL